MTRSVTIGKVHRCGGMKRDMRRRGVPGAARCRTSGPNSSSGASKRAASKGARKIKQRGMDYRRQVNGVHVTKGRGDIPGHDIAPTPAGILYLSFLG